jgi:hypothetical protein
LAFVIKFSVFALTSGLLFAGFGLSELFGGANLCLKLLTTIHPLKDAVIIISAVKNEAFFIFSVSLVKLKKRLSNRKNRLKTFRKTALDISDIYCYPFHSVNFSRNHSFKFYPSIY